MKISQSLPPPNNWQDFETLCQKLWAEIWSYPETKKNGRLGQNQRGIDIYGIPKGEIMYYGIQCKGKDLYTNKKLTESDITDEIEKAKTFEPNLKKLYFATTAVKDVQIETLVRKKNIEHIKDGLFEVHVYFWEDIVDLIFENKLTYDTYVNSNRFKSNQSVSVTFQDSCKELTVYPKFVEKIRVAKTKFEELEKQAEDMMPAFVKQMANRHMLTPHIFSTSFSHVPHRTEYNRSFIESAILITNDGSEPLEHWKLILTLPDKIIEVANKNWEKKGNNYAITPTIYFDTYIDNENHIVEVEPRKKILVGDDSFLSDTIYLKPVPEQTSIALPWKLVSRNFKQEGVLTLEVKPEIDFERIKVDDQSPLLLDEKKRITIEDYFETIEDE